MWLELTEGTSHQPLKALVVDEVLLSPPRALAWFKAMSPRSVGGPWLAWNPHSTPSVASAAVLRALEALQSLTLHKPSLNPVEG